MWNMNLILAVILLFTVESAPVPQQPVPAVSDLWLDVSLGPPLVDWFNSVAGPNDIARLENTNQLNLFDQITVGRKLLVFKSATEAERLIPGIANQVDIIGYNLEHDPANPADERDNPVASVRRMRALADKYGLVLAFGPDHDFALSDGVEIAPFVDIFVLQVQRVQTEPQTVFDFVLPLVPQLRKANPNLQISIQVRTEGDVEAIADLVSELKDYLDGISILTSPNTVPVAEALVKELQSRTASANPIYGLTELPVGETGKPAPPDNQQLLLVWGVLLAVVISVGLIGFLLLPRDRR